MALNRRIQDYADDCGDDDYVNVLTYIAAAQAKRRRILPQHRDDRVQDAVLYFWQNDLRLKFRTDAGCKFHSYVTTCVFRFLRTDDPLYKRLDATDYTKYRDSLPDSPQATEFVERLRTRHGDDAVESLLLYASRKADPRLADYNPATRHAVIQLFLKQAKDADETDPA